MEDENVVNFCANGASLSDADDQRFLLCGIQARPPQSGAKSLLNMCHSILGIEPAVTKKHNLQGEPLQIAEDRGVGGGIVRR